VPWTGSWSDARAFRGEDPSRTDRATAEWVLVCQGVGRDWLADGPGDPAAAHLEDRAGGPDRAFSTAEGWERITRNPAESAKPPTVTTRLVAATLPGAASGRLRILKRSGGCQPRGFPTGPRTAARLGHGSGGRLRLPGRATGPGRPAAPFNPGLKDRISSSAPRTLSPPGPAWPGRERQFLQRGRDTYV